MVVVAWKRDASEEASLGNPIKIFLEFMKPSISTRKVIRLSNLNEQIAFEQPDSPIIIKFKDFIPKKYPREFFPKEVEHLQFSYKTPTQVPFAEQILNGWTIS